ncbi:hypothetical protein ACHMW5_35890 (plasmid) [Azospirillum melinis]|uniref:hypothetical protein n=1 Tax=Azospirillum melinis TaxID=328839 RepID=UPI003757DCB6
MDGIETKARRPRGRPAKYLDDADRQAAHRERQAGELAAGQVARRVLDRPTMASVKKQIGRLMDQAADREAVRVELLAYLAAGAGSTSTA